MIDFSRIYDICVKNYPNKISLQESNAEFKHSFFSLFNDTSKLISNPLYILLVEKRNHESRYIYISTSNRFEVEIPITWKSLGSMDTDNSVMRKFDKIPLI